MRLIVALGNPGAEYARSRHNAGWRALDIVAAGWGPFASEGPVTVARGKIAGGDVWVVKPQAYMNRSGMAFVEWLDDRPEVEDAVSRLIESAGGYSPPVEGWTPKGDGVVPPPPLRDEDANASLAEDEEDMPPEKEWPGILVVTDDVNLPLGRMRFRPGGSDGGHNGLADIAAALGSEAYPRLRIGVGAVPAGMDLKDWVLGPFGADETELAERVWKTAAEAARAWASEGFERARDRYNGLKTGDAPVQNDAGAKVE